MPPISPKQNADAAMSIILLARMDTNTAAQPRKEKFSANVINVDKRSVVAVLFALMDGKNTSARTVRGNRCAHMVFKRAGACNVLRQAFNLPDCANMVVKSGELVGSALGEYVQYIYIYR
jgi:hypothetical protein